MLNNSSSNKKIILLTGFYAILALMISFILLNTINSINQTKHATAIVAKPNDKTIVTPAKVLSTLSVPNAATDISISQDNKYCMYVLNGTINILDITNNKLVHKINEQGHLAKAVLLHDRSIIMYFTINKSHLLKVKTYNLDNQKETLQQAFSIGTSNKVKAVDYSCLTNLIMINTENNSKVNRVYYINIMKRIGNLTTENTVNNMVLLNNSMSLYYTDNNKLYCNRKKISSTSSKDIRILGRNSSDSIFAQDINKKNLIYVLKNRDISKVIKLPDGNFSDVIRSGNNVFLVYKDYAINIIGDYNKKLWYDNSNKLISIINGNFYLKSNKNLVLIEAPISK